VFEVAFIALVASEPKMANGKGGKSYCSISASTNNRFMRVTAFNSVAEAMMTAKRQDRVYIEGRITQFEYEGRIDIQVVASFIHIAAIGENGPRALLTPRP
jgi:single-stranded DNA-binding protein